MSMNLEMMLTHSKIADRASELGIIGLSRLSLIMDLEAAQIKFNLDCEKLLWADEFNFRHDICGIQNHIDRQATNLFSNPPKVIFKNCFVPRFAKRED